MVFVWSTESVSSGIPDGIVKGMGPLCSEGPDIADGFVWAAETVGTVGTDRTGTPVLV